MKRTQKEKKKKGKKRKVKIKQKIEEIIIIIRQILENHRQIKEI